MALAVTCLSENDLTELLEGAQPPEVDAHLDECARCREVVAELLRATPHPPSQPSVPTVLDAGTASSTARLARGTPIGRYLVLEWLGVGGMGVVYAAYDPELDRRVALKLLRGGEAEGEAGSARLSREAKALARVAHASVVTVHDVGTVGERVFIAMELLEGGTLAAWLKVAPRPWREVLRAFQEAGQGLAAAHGAGLVHRDFKPQNVLLGKDGRWRVTDFGLARPVGALPSEAGGGTVTGTPSYMAPEQLAGLPADARTDQFSFCVALYEALCGQAPFAGNTLLERSAQLRAGALRPFPRDTAAPGWVRRAVLRGLSARPEQRFATMAELLSALSRDPFTARRRAASVAALVALAVGGVFLSRAVEHRQRQAACGSGERQLAQVWGDAQRAEARDRFLKTGRPYAEAAFATVDRALGSYTRSWGGLHRQTCEAARASGPAADGVVALKQGCLSVRLQEVSALAALLRQATPQTVEQAAAAVSALTPLEGCSDAEVLSGRLPPPPDPALRARVEEARGVIAQARANRLLGRYREGAAEATAAVETATALAHRPLLAEALFQQAQLEEKLGENAASERSFKRAAWAAEASRYDVLAARALSELVFVLSARLNRLEDAETWSEQAKSAAERLGDPGPVLAAAFETNLGVLRYMQARYPEALEHHQRALALREKLYGGDHLDVANSLSLAGSTLQVMGRLAEALAMAERALAMRLRLLGADHPLIATGLANVAGLNLAHGRADQAVEAFRRALAIKRASLPADHPSIAITLSALSEALGEQGKLEESTRFAQEALDLLERQGQGQTLTAARARIALGELHLLAHSPVAAEREARTVVRIYEKALGPDHPDGAAGQHLLAKSLEAQGRWREALVLRERALELRLRSLGEEHVATARARAYLGNVQLQLGRRAEARKQLTRALEVLEGKSNVGDVKAAVELNLARTGAAPERRAL